MRTIPQVEFPQYEKSLSVRNGYSVFEALDPYDGNLNWDLLMPLSVLGSVGKFGGLGKPKELGYVVRSQMLEPRAVFLGVRDVDNDVDDDDWYCYLCEPSHRFNYGTGERYRVPANRLMLAYVTNERVFYNWYWVERDPDEWSRPIDCEGRFKGVIYEG